MISVVIATFNRAKLLPRALDSLQRQTIDDWEAVVVDDGSCDETQSLLSNYSQLDARIRPFRQANGGLCSARNRGLQNARGELITFLDSDDEYKPEHLEMRIRFLAEHPDVDIIHGRVVIVGGSDTVPDLHDPTRSIPISECFVGGTFVMRAHVPAEIGGFRQPDFASDHEFMTRAMERFKILHFDCPTYIYHRETPDSMCNVLAALNATDEKAAGPLS